MEPDDDKTQSHFSLTVGTAVSHYKIVSRIGSGGMGEVWLADDTKLKRQVALKFMPAHAATDASLKARFTREAQAAAKLSHPNIVTVFEVGEFNGRPFFAMEYVPGDTLRDIIKGGKLTTSEAVRITMQVCEGLHKAHEAGVVHRDMKPGNIIIDEDNRPRILDFGLATLAGDEKLTKTGSTLGTVGYMSPEQVEGKQVDHRSDLFSVGVILYEMLTGRRPFEGDNDAAVVKAITDANPEPVARFKSGVTGELQQIVDKALTKDPSLRYQHADGMLADLKRLRADSGPMKKSRRGLWAAALVVVCGITGYYAIDRLSTSREATEGWANSVAVLVFRDLSPEKDQDWFCEGMTDEIIGRLQAIRQLKVTSMQSMLRFKDTDKDLREIGKELGVANILEGNIQREGDSIRIRAQLIRVEDDAHIWSERYYREVQSVFAIQEEISRTIANVLEVTLGSAEATFPSKRGTDNLEAYNAYTRGVYFWRKRTEEGLTKAIEHFEKAIALDSNYAQAWSYLATSWAAIPHVSNITERDAYPYADRASLKALKLDDGLAETHASRGLVLHLTGKYQEAEEELLLAIKLNPGYSWAHNWYADLVLNRFGKQDEFDRHIRIAHDLDPLSLPVLNQLLTDARQKGDMEK
ncbi:MAG: protein kinase, partial [Candidatus Zixiibacteriota bacterium]